MKIINPNEIGTKISTLVSEANKKVIIVSPFISISHWKKMLVNLERAINRGVLISIYYREIKIEDQFVLEKMGIKLFHVDGLHTKLYFNDENAIVSSMNLYEYSDLNSIELAIDYSDPEDYKRLFEYFEKYIHKPTIRNSANDSSRLIPTSTKRSIQNVSENLDSLELLREKLVSKYNVKVNRATDYLFTRDLSPIFDIFFHENEISLKIPNKKIELSKINAITKILPEITDSHFDLSTPNESYRYFVYNVAYNIDELESTICFINALNLAIKEIK
jgi:sugar-specific transcriptional regulator TrmB